MCAIDGAREVAGAAARDDHRAASAARPEAHQRVLLVADADRLTVWSLRHYLRDSHRVVQANTAADVSEHLERGPADALVVSDNLPAGQVRRLLTSATEQDPTLRIIKLVSLVEQDDGETPEPVTVLEKPFDLGHLKELLD
jgi:DNA-binding NtrC family response regulator